MAERVTSDGPPIFLGGVAGTGKTRLGSLLGRHSRIAVIRKTYLWRDFYGRFGDLSDPVNLDRCLDAVLASPAFRSRRLDPGRIREEASRRPPTYGAVFALFHDLHAAELGKPRWCDQLGLVEMYADAIFAELPDARMVHMVRDPRSPGVTDPRPGLAGWMLGKWVTSVELAARNEGRYGPRYLVVRQEDFRADEAATLRLVCDHIGETHEPSVLDGDTGPSRGHDEVAPRRHSRFVETAAGGLMERSGYRTEGPDASKDLRYRLVDAPANALGLAAWRHLRRRGVERRVGVGR